MNVLVVGFGGREHAIVWALRKSPRVSNIFCAPGNAGTGMIAENISIKADDLDALTAFAAENNIDLTVVGSEAPLVKGIVDRFEQHGLKIFGPSEAAARLEGSKIFLKNFLKRHSIPTAGYAAFNQSDFEKARKYLQSANAPYVIKTDGLAAGKGVTICPTYDEAVETLQSYFEEKIFGDAGVNIVIEECMVGEEASVFAMCDGEDYVVLSPAQDHKRIGDGDTGKNTGGMGAYAPAPVMPQELLDRVKKEIITPTLKGMKSDGHPYSGCLYVGLMITTEGPKVVEFNVRLGDPETQVVIPLIESDVFDLFYSCATGTIKEYTLKLSHTNAVVVVLASDGYPDHYESGKEISGLNEASVESIVFHAGTKKSGDTILSAGGRVLGVTAIGDTLRASIDKAYRSVKKISFDNARYRTDIGLKGLNRKA